MNGIDKILAYIKAESVAECEEIYRNAAEECGQIRADYTLLEQNEYWKYINTGSKETDHRREQLQSFAVMEANKQLLSTQQEMVDEAFALAAKKLLELPKKEYAGLLKRLVMDANCSADDIVERFRNELSLKIVSVLFD